MSVTHESTTSLSFLDEFLCSDVSLLEVDVTCSDAEGADIAISIEPLTQVNPDRLLCAWGRITHRVIVKQRRKVRIRHDSIERAIDLVRYVANDLQIGYIAFISARLHEAGELGSVGEMLAHIPFRQSAEMTCHGE